MPARLALLLALAFALQACATERALFRPREKVLAESPDGYPAALYVLDDAGKSVGELRIWSAGAWREDNDAHRTVIHLGLEIENRTGAPLTLDVDATDLRQLTASGRQLTHIERLDLRGSPEVPDRDVGRVEFLFALPPDTHSPTDLDGFHAHWLLRGPDQRDFEQLTPFGRDFPTTADRTRWRGGIGLGWGWGWSYWDHPYYWSPYRCYW